MPFQLGDLEAAWRYAEEGLAVYRELGDYWGVSISLNNLGCLAQDQGELRRARGLFQESVAIYREIGIRSGLATALGNLGDACVQLEKYAEAESCLRVGKVSFRKFEDPALGLEAMNGRGEILVRAVELDGGRKLEATPVVADLDYPQDLEFHSQNVYLPNVIR